MIKRGTFMGLAAGAAMGTMGNASGQSVRVAEDDPAISTAHVQIQRADIQMPAYTARPRNARADTPGVVVVMHIWGVDDSIREVVRGFAKEGFAAIAPDLYARFGAPDGDGAQDYTKFVPFAQKLQRDQVDGDLRAAALWLRSAHPQGSAGVTGFCMGGAIALRQAVDNADVFAADAVWYGNVADIDPSKVHIPLLGSYGELDHGIPADGVRAFQKALSVPNDIVIYPNAGHAFFDHTRASYVESAAAASWPRTIAFFTKYLKMQRE